MGMIFSSKVGEEGNGREQALVPPPTIGENSLIIKSHSWASILYITLNTAEKAIDGCASVLLYSTSPTMCLTCSSYTGTF